jgi:hypothetical protein
VGMRVDFLFIFLADCHGQVIFLFFCYLIY